MDIGGVVPPVMCHDVSCWGSSGGGSLSLSLSLSLSGRSMICVCVCRRRRGALQYTARKKSASRVEMLLGAQCRFGMLVDPRGHSALQSALKNERKHVVWMLLQAISRSVSEQPRALQPFMRHRAEIASKCVAAAARHPPRVCPRTNKGNETKKEGDSILHSSK